MSALGSAIIWTVLAASGSADAGNPVPSFELRDVEGQPHRLADWKDREILVVVFLGTECPLANLYVPRLTEIQSAYADRGVTVVAINSNIQDSKEDLAGYAGRHQLTFPLLHDPNAKVADLFHAERTPEVFVLDRNRVVRYRGKIDDQYGVGFQKPEASRHDLRLAIDELLAGKEVSVPETQAVGCIIGRPRPSEEGASVTFSGQIAQLFHERCVNCHRPGEVAPFAMLEYDEVVGWAETIREVVELERMPPWHASPEHGEFKNCARLTDSEKQMIFDWVDAGAPLGNADEIPEPPTFVEGWQIGEPDDIFYIADNAVPVPAEGVVDYQYYVVDPGWTEDKWIQAAECRPGSRAVVHHIIAFIQPPNEISRRARRGGIGGYAPGMPPEVFEPGVAKFVQAGSKIIFQMHYTPNGTATTDRSCIGVRYADPANVTKIAHGGMAANLLFRIPAGADNHKVTSTYTFRDDVMLRTLTPHMHVRGKSFRFEAEYPDGTREILLDVPRYDFNWQLRYEFASLKPIPKGTKLECTAYFDNSAGNLNNPDPTKPVRWGDQTWEEMMIGWFSTVSERGVANEEDETAEVETRKGG